MLTEKQKRDLAEIEEIWRELFENDDIWPPEHLDCDPKWGKYVIIEFPGTDNGLCIACRDRDWGCARHFCDMNCEIVADMGEGIKPVDVNGHEGFPWEPGEEKSKYSLWAPYYDALRMASNFNERWVRIIDEVRRIAEDGNDGLAPVRLKSRGRTTGKTDCRMGKTAFRYARPRASRRDGRISGARRRSSSRCRDNGRDSRRGLNEGPSRKALSGLFRGRK